MIRRSTLVLMLAAAAISAAVTAAVFTLGTADEPVANGGGGAISTSAAIQPSSPPASDPPMSRTSPTLAFTRSAVDWAAVYALAAPSQVTIQGTNGGGAGFFVSTEGHIITNLHVVEGSPAIAVYTHEKVRLDAELIARDTGNDLALLKVDPEGLEIAVPKFGSTAELRVGDPVGALGAPFGLPDTLTVGVISALGRTRPSTTDTWEPLRETIQTDAALNPGNSGGMLIDAQGRLIGIPTQIVSDALSSAGLGFAVSVDSLQRSLPILLNGRDVERGFLGLSMEDSVAGLVITNVFCNTPAHEAGLRANDLIVRLNGAEIESSADLVTVMRGVYAGEEITITVQRGRRTLTRTQTVSSWPTAEPEIDCR